MIIAGKPRNKVFFLPRGNKWGNVSRLLKRRNGAKIWEFPQGGQ